MKNSRVLRKQILRLQYLETEYEECVEIHDEAKREFQNAVRNLHYKLNIFDEDLDQKQVADKSVDNKASILSEKSEEEIQKIKPDIPSWAKKLFRQVVKLTHPDKLSNDLEKETHDRLIKMYQDAKEAIDSCDFAKIALIAQELNISLKNIDIKDFALFRKKESEFQEKIKRIKTSMFWLWSNSTDVQKDKIIQEFLKSKGWTKSSMARKKSRKNTHPGQSAAWARSRSFFSKKEDEK
mgnify:CR=1 FL=1|tara:strand:+ start:711 stop:1424 length:714 start_codon:yes stop_codon:yes gene_type:complete